MRVAIEADDVRVGEDVLAAVDREVSERATSPTFLGVRDVRLRLRRAKGMLLCIVAVGFAGGDLVTSTATSETPLKAIVGALDGLPERIERIHRRDPRGDSPASGATSPGHHAAVREQLKKLLG